MVALAEGPKLKKPNMAKSVLTDTTTKLDIWYRKLWHQTWLYSARCYLLQWTKIWIHHMFTNYVNTLHVFMKYFSKKPSKWQLPTELSPPWNGIHGDVCGPINLPSSIFRYFFILIHASGSHLKVSLLPTRNMVLPKLLAIETIF